MKFTDRGIKAIRLPETGRIDVWADNGNGFGLRVSSTGRKVFQFAYRFEGKARRMMLGEYGESPNMTLAEAHKVHALAREQLAKGIDPGAVEQEAKREAQAAPTVAQLVEEYIERWAKPRKRTWPEDARMLGKDVIPRWGERKAKDITRRDVLKMLDELQDRGCTTSANRTLACVRKMFNFGVERDMIETSPCTNVRAPVQEVQRDRVLSPEELQTFWNRLDDAHMSEGSRLALRLQLLTATRKGEVLAAAWGDFDLKGCMWTIPVEESKNKMPHRVPLSTQAMAILDRIKTISGDSPWLFPSRNDATRHAIETSVDHAVRRNQDHFGIGQFTPHDLRRTAASQMTEMGISRLVVSKILNHVERGITAVYDRHSYDAEKRAALDAWGKRLETIVTGQDDHNVVELPVRKVAG
ncbi:MAG: tyrosine-type recombinase/integrase [Magnetococcales bacterium]|nr:tyrosine-type recombinase/integrase [Magnetococcales bacterium]